MTVDKSSEIIPNSAKSCHDHIHVITPGDHYSPTTGSAVCTRVYELSRCHERRGGRSFVVVGHDTRKERYDAGQCINAELERLPSLSEKLVDIALGGIGLERHYHWSKYKGAAEVLDPDFDGTIFLHNAPAVVSQFRQRFPRAKVCLYGQDHLFRTYLNGEVRKCISASDYGVFVSEFLAGTVRQRLSNANRQKIVSVLNGVDVDRFCPQPKADENKTEPVILFVARIQPIKGPHLLLKATSRIYDKKRRRFRVRIVGRKGFDPVAPLSNYERELRGIAADLGTAVDFVGFVDRNGIADEYRRADIFCAPSDWGEPCTHTVPEAMASGCAVVAARVGGIPEAGADAIQYFERGDIDGLCDRLIYLIENESTRAEWSKKARQRATAITWEDQYRKLCESINEPTSDL